MLRCGLDPDADAADSAQGTKNPFLGQAGKKLKILWKKNPSKLEDQAPWRGRLHGTGTVDGFNGGESTHVGQT